MKFTFYQPDTEENTLASYNLEGLTPKNADLAFGTMLNELFHTISLQKDTGAKFFKLSKPIMVSIESDAVQFDTAVLHKKAQQRLKLNSKAASKRRFAKRFVAMARFALRTPELLTVKQAVETLLLEEQIAE